MKYWKNMEKIMMMVMMMMTEVSKRKNKFENRLGKGGSGKGKIPGKKMS